MASRRNRRVSIFELSPQNTALNEGQCRQCQVDINVDGIRKHTAKFLSDPFESMGDVALSDYDWYIEQYPPCTKPRPQSMTLNEIHAMDVEDERNEKKAHTVRSKLDKYRQVLFSQLGLDDADFSDAQRLHINIHESDDNGTYTTTPQFGISHFLWEILEDPNQWTPNLQIMPASDQLHVTVKRIVPTSISTGLSFESRLISHQSPFRVLLVIARSLTKSSKNDYQDLPPHLAQILILRIQEYYKPLYCAPEVDLEILRPGTFEALKRRLELDKEEERKPFDLIHFDLHGDVDKDKNNVFIFFANNDIESPGLVRKSAEEVASLLRDCAIRCVVTNACRTAAIFGRQETNFSKVLVKHGIGHVTAMSHKISTTAVEHFYRAFYQALLVEPFFLPPEAASHGRKQMREDLKRKFWDVNTKVDILLQDWCVPVTYVQQTTPHAQNYGQTATWLIQSAQSRLFGILRYSRNTFVARLKTLFATRQNSPNELSHSSGLSSSQQSIDSGPQNPSGSQQLPLCDIGILDLEKHLVRYRFIYFHGPNYELNQRTLGSLAVFWLMTGFIDCIVHIYIEETSLQPKICLQNRSKPQVKKCTFLEPETFNGLRSNLGKILKERIPNPKPEIAIIVHGIHTLYPKSEEEYPAEQKGHFSRVREELDEFLRPLVDDELTEQLTYLVVTGKYEKQWWEELVDWDITGKGKAFLRKDVVSCAPLKMPRVYI